MSGREPIIAGATSAQDAARDWEAVRAATDIQYAPLAAPRPPAPPPDWLKGLSEWLRGLLEPLGQALGVSWPVIEKILIVLAVLGVALILWRIAAPIIADRRRADDAPAEPEWAPERAAAAALLEDADRLAAAGRYGEAAHLLLQRSVHHIAEARPEWVHPATTAREIATLASLPDRARHAFGVIAVRVERSLFALRDLDLADWQAARSAYADFALAELKR